VAVEECRYLGGGWQPGAACRCGVPVRDTQDRTGPVLRFGPAAWRRFAGQVKRSLASGARAEGAALYGSMRGLLGMCARVSRVAAQLYRLIARGASMSVNGPEASKRL
jgi:hypothetical protein